MGRDTRNRIKGRARLGLKASPILGLEMTKLSKALFESMDVDSAFYIIVSLCTTSLLF